MKTDVLALNRIDHYLDALYTAKYFFDVNDDNADYLRASLSCKNAIEELSNEKLKLIKEIGGTE